MEARAHLLSQWFPLTQTPPDSRAWFDVPRQGMLDPDENRMALLPVPAGLAGNNIVFGPGHKVRLEVECEDRSARSTVQATLTDMLEEEGYIVGEGEFLLRFTFTVSDGIAFNLPTEGTMVMPKTIGRLELLAPDRTVVKEARIEAHWGDVSAKFMLKSESGLKRGLGPDTTINQYDFGSKSPKQAVLEAERMAIIQKVEQLQWARAVARGPGGNFIALPRTADK